MITWYQGRKHVRADLPMAVSNATRSYRRSCGMDDDTLVRYAREALTRPSSFAYYGGYDMFRTWGHTGIGQSRDSDALEESNYARILQDMRKAHPDEDMGDHVLEWISDYRASHWAVGWVEGIIARVLYDPEDDITPDNITSAFREVIGIAEWLRTDYPVYDDSDYSEREYAEVTGYFEQEWSALLRRWDEADGPEPTDAEREFIWETHDSLSDSDPCYDSDRLAEYVLSLRAERIAATKAAVSRLLKG